MLRSKGEAQPTPRGVGSGLICELAPENEKLGALYIGDGAQICLGHPLLEAHRVGETGLLIERFVGDAGNRTALPGELVSVDHNVAPCLAGELPKLDEEDAATFGKGRMAKTLRIKEKRARGPVPVFVGEHALEHEDLLSLRMVVRWKVRVGLVAHDRGDLPRLGRTH